MAVKSTSSLDSTAEAVMLEAKGVKKYFATQGGFLSRILGSRKTVRAVDGVDLSVRENETVAVVGESGCGKTTLGRTIANLYSPTAGTIEFRGRPVTSIPKRELAKNIQVIFQDPMSSLNPKKRASEIVGKPLQIHGIVPDDEIRERVAALFDEVGLQESHLDRYPHEFSGGQRQRIGIARALAPEPELIIADEPVSALDVSVQAKIINLLDILQERHNISYVFISHDMSVVNQIADRVAVMYLGKFVESGPVEDIFFDPHHPYTRALLRTVPRIEDEVTYEETVMEQEIPSVTDRPRGCSFHTRCPEFIGGECVKQEPDLEPVDGSGEHFSACHWHDHSEEKRRSHEPPQNS